LKEDLEENDGRYFDQFFKGGHKMKKNGRKQVKKAEGKKAKDPKRVEAAKKAWETIRAKAKEKQVIK
jgi:hypothetical protein